MQASRGLWGVGGTPLANAVPQRGTLFGGLQDGSHPSIRLD